MHNRCRMAIGVAITLVMMACSWSSANAQAPSAAKPPETPAPMTLPTPAPETSPPALKGPSFQSGGLKLTVANVSNENSTISMSLLLENKSNQDMQIAIIGVPLGVNHGSPYTARLVGGVAYCAARNNPTASQQLSICLTGDSPELTLQRFTMIERGNAVPATLTLEGPKLDPAKPFSFAMNVAVIKTDESAASDETLTTSDSKRSGKGLPPGMRFVSLGIPLLSLNQ